MARADSAKAGHHTNPTKDAAMLCRASLAAISRACAPSEWLLGPKTSARAVRVRAVAAHSHDTAGLEVGGETVCRVRICR
jgi:hypothetical protein